ncbi:MAG: ribosome recycling factor [Sedimentisphaerales bacterium]|nr:ribosome recycling factor [Sedimentisphaerales bacterium]
MSYDDILLEAEESMDKAVDFLRSEYRTLRTGRASTALVEHIKVDYYGAPTPLKQLANLSAPEANLIVIKPFDASSLKDIEKAIIASSLGITPNTDGRVIRLSVPALSGERRQQLANQVKQMAEQARVSVRNTRRDANKHFDQAEKDKTITEDDRDKGKKEIDDLTKKYTSQIDDVLKTKTDEIMEV